MKQHHVELTSVFREVLKGEDKREKHKWTLPKVMTQSSSPTGETLKSPRTLIRYVSRQDIDLIASKLITSSKVSAHVGD